MLKYHMGEVFIPIKWQSLNLISMSKPEDIGFAMLQQFSKADTLNSLKNQRELLICFTVMSMCMILFCNNLLTKFAGQWGAAGMGSADSTGHLPPASAVDAKATATNQGWRPRLCDPCLQVYLIPRPAPPWRMRTGCQPNCTGTGSCPLAGVPTQLLGLSPRCTIGL